MSGEGAMSGGRGLEGGVLVISGDGPPFLFC